MGAVVVSEGEEVMAITAGGGVIRTPISEDALRLTSRDTMGVRLMNLGEGDTVVAVAGNAERADDDVLADAAVDDAVDDGLDGESAPPGEATDEGDPT